MFSPLDVFALIVEFVFDVFYYRWTTSERTTVRERVAERRRKREAERG